MPAAYTHYIVTRETFRAFPESLQEKLLPHLPLCFFGAQGPDFCFFYKLLPPPKNLGSFLHQKGSFTSFRVLKALSVTPAQLAYALGFITHYAADVVFHPFIYGEVNRSLIQHTRLENALDFYFKSKQQKSDPYQAYAKPALRKEALDELFLAYAAIVTKCGLPPLHKRAFFRSISLFNAYLPMPNALLSASISFEKDRVDGLLSQAITLSKDLCAEFLKSIEERAPLSKELFGRSYLTGLPQ